MGLHLVLTCFNGFTHPNTEECDANGVLGKAHSGMDQAWAKHSVQRSRFRMGLNPEQFLMIKIIWNHAGWWFQPLWKILVSWEKKCPPTSMFIVMFYTYMLTYLHGYLTSNDGGLITKKMEIDSADSTCMHSIEPTRSYEQIAEHCRF